VASRAEPNDALPPVMAFPASQTGMETIIQRITRLMRVKIMFVALNSNAIKTTTIFKVSAFI